MAASKIVLDLKVGKIPVTCARDAEGQLFGEMQQGDPVFGKIHDRATVVTRDTRDEMVGLRARGIDSLGEDPATGSAAGCTASWMVRYGLQKSAETLHIEQGVEMQRPSHMYARAEKHGDKITNVRVGGHAVEVAQGEYAL